MRRSDDILQVMMDASADEIRRDLKVLLVKRLRLRGVPPESIVDGDPLVKGPLGLDSIDVLEIAVAVEERYGFRVSDESLNQEAFQSIASLAEFVRRNLTTTDAPQPSCDETGA